MAPRTAKAKKAVDVKEAEGDAVKQAEKGKNIEEPVIDTKNEIEDTEKVSVTDKKAKRGKRKAANGTSEQVEDIKETAPPSKKGKKEKAEVSEEDNNTPKEESVPIDGNDQNGDEIKTNGDTEETTNAPASKGRKAKKEAPKDKPIETKSGRGKKNIKPEKVNDEIVEDTDTVEKSSSKRGRSRKVQQKDEPEPESEDKAENVKTEKPPAKGRKKAAKPAPKEKTPEIEEDDNQEEEKVDEPKKKEVKSRKNRGKKAKEVKEDDVEREEAEKKDEKGQGDSKDEDAEEEETEAKPVKGKRAAKKRTVEAPGDEEPQDTGEPKKKKRAPSEDAKTAPPKNKSSTDFENLDFKNSSKNPQEKEWNFKISSWNVDGIRAWLSKGGLDYIKYEKPDILCLQEIKCSKEKLPAEVANLPGYHAYWLCSEKDGYAGVGIYTTKMAIGVQYGLQNEELDSEGRIITAEYEHFYLICTYVPNAGRNLVTLPKRLQWNEEFRKFVKELDKKKPVIICGDMNVAHNEIDLTNPKTNKKNAGFTVEERMGMTELLGDGFVDTYRHLYPDKTGAYTFWTYMKNCRAKNIGWRLDYFIVSQRLLPALCDSTIRDGVYGSDHCPISLFLHLSSAVKRE